MKRVKMVALASCAIASLLALSAAISAAPARAGARSANARATREMNQRLKRMGMDSEMILRCKMLMNAEVSRSNPSSLLAAKGDLKLTAEQVQKLKSLIEETRDKARAILTEEQRKQVDALPVLPATNIAMHQKIAALMKEKDATPKCPIMEAAVAATRPAAAEK